MEKIFQPNKWFVGFCALLIIVWAFLQLVANMRVSDEAKNAAGQILSWSWSNPNCAATAEISTADVVRRTATDAIVKVKGKQNLTLSDAAGASRQKTVDCAATLTFYRLNNDWILGKVELN